MYRRDASEILESNAPRRPAHHARMMQRVPVKARVMAVPYRRQYP
jgi:hypothetical protein